MVNNDDWLQLRNPITIESLKKLRKFGHIDKIYAKQDPLLTGKVAKGFKEIISVGQIWLWCKVTKAAISHIVAIPKLKMLDVLSIKSYGKLSNFSAATSLEHFYCADTERLSVHDFKEILSCKTLKEVNFPNSTLSPEIIQHLLNLSNLQVLDIEGSNFNDKMASLLSRSKTIVSLEIASTVVSRKGLADICKMNQLKSLDVWATDIKQKDLELLKNLPELEYLSVGQGYDDNSFESKKLIEMLAKMNSLQRIWLDGIKFSSDEKIMLSRKYDKVQISYNDEIITL